MKMYVVDIDRPWEPIAYVEMSRRTQFYVIARQRRFKIGSSAFVCLGQAKPRQVALLEAIVGSWYLRRFHTLAWQKANATLAKLKPPVNAVNHERKQP